MGRFNGVFRMPDHVMSNSSPSTNGITWARMPKEKIAYVIPECESREFLTRLWRIFDQQRVS